jgi:L-aminopeptidase/D-esterase-like protein
MASRRVDAGGAIVTVAALAVVNASGSVIDHTSGLPWCRPGSLQRPSAGERRRLAALTSPAQPMNTTIGVVATDADLSRPESGRLAQSAHDGLARAIRPAHSLTDGDTVFGLATGACSLPDHGSGLLRHPASRSAALNMLFAAAAEAFATACTDAVLCATRIGSDPSYRELCPTAFGDR